VLWLAAILVELFARGFQGPLPGKKSLEINHKDTPLPTTSFRPGHDCTRFNFNSGSLELDTARIQISSEEKEKREVRVCGTAKAWSRTQQESVPSGTGRAEKYSKDGRTRNA
jgi:hypothetical protein